MIDFKYLEVFKFDKKKRYGNYFDGGYVIGEIEDKYDCYISCGISDEESFTRDFLEEHNYLKKEDCYAFDGTIKDFPWEYTTNINFFKKNIGSVDDDNNTNLKSIIEKYEKVFFKIDIESGEYPWIMSIDESILKKLMQITIEFHGMCGGYIGSEYSRETKIECLKKLSNTHYIVHAHGNNFSHVTDGIPDVIELTYINKNYFQNVPELNKTKLPIKGLDFPNKKDSPDIPLNIYPFNNCQKKPIHIGPSNKNNVRIKFDLPKSTELEFSNNYSDKFEYSITDNELIVTRIDQDSGWGQDLYAYALL